MGSGWRTLRGSESVAANLATSPGRGPAEAEELIAWMQASEEAWRER